jgi:hypothetical protein
VHTFKVGDRVQWDPKMLTPDRPDVKSVYGDGPFIIHNVCPVVTSCTCGSEAPIIPGLPIPKRRGMPHKSVCGVHALGGAGHHQQIMLEGIQTVFSGKWFIPAESKTQGDAHEEKT